MFNEQSSLRAFLDVIYTYLPFFWMLVFLTLTILSLLRFRASVSGLLFGAAFGLSTVLNVVRYVVNQRTFEGVDYNATSRVVFNLVAHFGIPILLQIVVIVGVALIPRSLRQLGMAADSEEPAMPPAGFLAGERPAGGFDLGLALGEGWRAFSKNAGVAIGAGLIYLVLNLIGSFIPILNFIYIFFIMGPFTAGLAILGLKLVDGRPASVGDLFGGFSQFGRYLGASWLISLICLAIELVAVIPAGVAVLAAYGLESSGGYSYGEESAAPVVIVVLGVVTTLVLLVLGLIRFLTPYVFALLVIADKRDNGSAQGALRESARLVDGMRIRIALTMLLLSLIASIGLVGFLVGYLITAPWMLCAMASMYRQLAGQRPVEPVAPAASAMP